MGMRRRSEMSWIDWSEFPKGSAEVYRKIARSPHHRISTFDLYGTEDLTYIDLDVCVAALIRHNLVMRYLKEDLGKFESGFAAVV